MFDIPAFKKKPRPSSCDFAKSSEVRRHKEYAGSPRQYKKICCICSKPFNKKKRPKSAEFLHDGIVKGICSICLKKHAILISQAGIQGIEL